jgi:hypothetical protein
MHFERKKKLLGLSALFAGVALAGCGGGSDNDTPNPTSGVIAVDSSLGLDTSSVTSEDETSSTVSLSNNRTAFRPAGTGPVAAGSVVGTVESFASVLPGLSSSTADRPILVDSFGNTDVNTGLYLQPNGNITVGAVGSNGSSKGISPYIAIGDGTYSFHIDGPLFVKNSGNVLTINNRFTVEFTVSSGVVGLPNRIFGNLPANGSPGRFQDSFGNTTSLTLTTEGFRANGATTSLSITGTNANRQQEQTVVGGSATFRFSENSTFAVPAGGLNAVTYRANAGVPGGTGTGNN